MILYFGVINGRGHDMWVSETDIALPPSPDDSDVWASPMGSFELPWSRVDCALCPGKRYARRGDWVGEVEKVDQREGEYALHHRDGWTALAWWDRSGRNGFWSNSTLFAQGTFTAAEMLAMAHVSFPSVMARIDYKFTEGRFYEPSQHIAVRPKPGRKASAQAS